MEAYQVLCMSMNGDTCIAFGMSCPCGWNRKVTLAPHGVLVTSAMHTWRASAAPRQ
jgi:hypothetical protein